MNQRAPLFLLLLSLFVFSCGTENEPTYTLTTTVSPNEGGTISPSEGEFTEGEQIALAGNPTSDGWVFSRWEGDWSGTSNPVNITIDKNYTIIGVFERRDYPLNITIEGEGTVTETIVSQPTTDYSYETIVELTPNPSEGWEFVEWGGDLSGSESPQQVTVDGETNVVVKFERRDYPLNITIEGEGMVTETIVSQPTTDYTYETIVELTPNPSEGWRFVEWGGDLGGSESPQQITIDGEKNVMVKFENLFYLGENGITVMCPETEVGDKGTINGIEYESVDRELLIQRRDGGGDLTKVCVSNVTDMSYVFLYIQFNQPISNWDVSNVTNMSYMFGYSQFNQPIGNWDVSNVTDVSFMFTNSQFNQPIGDWDVSSVTNMSSMFIESQFNQSIENWDVSNVTDMSYLFSGTNFTTSTFNQPIGNWDVSNVTDMSNMFAYSQFNQPIGNWDVSKVTDMSRTFGGTPFNQAIENWDVSNVTDMEYMFGGSQFNQPIENWDVSNVNNMSGMFTFSQFNQPINDWCVSQFSSEPNFFSFRSPLTEENKPIWGTCPD